MYIRNITNNVKIQKFFKLTFLLPVTSVFQPFL